MQFFKKYDEYLLTENINQAKKFVLDNYNDPTSNNELKEIIRICSTKNSAGYAYLMTVFHFKFNLSLSDITKLIDRLKEFNTNKLIDKLSKLPVDYIDDGPEKLDDAMNQLERNNKANRIYNELPNNLKLIIDRETPDNKNKFKEASILLFELPDKKDLIKKISYYKTFNDLLNGITLFIKKRSEGSDYYSKLEQLKNDSGVIITYQNPERETIVARIDTYEASKKFGSDAWCITRSESTFYSYLKTIYHAQYFIWLYDKDITDNLFMIGVTVNDAGKISYAHAKNDVSVLGRIKKILDVEGIPINVLKQKNIDTDWDSIVKKLDSIKDNKAFIGYFKNKNLLNKYIEYTNPEKTMEILSSNDIHISYETFVFYFLKYLDEINVEKYLRRVIPYFLTSNEKWNQFIDIVKKYVKNEKDIVESISIYSYEKNKGKINKLINETIHDDYNKLAVYSGLDDFNMYYEIYKNTGKFNKEHWQRFGEWMVKQGKFDELNKLIDLAKPKMHNKAQILQFYIKNKMNKEFIELYNTSDYKKDALKVINAQSQNKFDFSLLEEAMYSDNLEIVKFFVEEKKVTIKREFSNNYQLVYCCTNGYVNVFKYLIDYFNMDPNNSDAYWLKDRPLESKKQDSHYGEYVMSCIKPNYSSDKYRSDRFKILTWLVEEKNADITFRFNEPLLRAITEKNIKITKFLISKGCRLSKEIMNANPIVRNMNSQNILKQVNSWIDKDMLKEVDMFTE